MVTCNKKKRVIDNASRVQWTRTINIIIAINSSLSTYRVHSFHSAVTPELHFFEKFQSNQYCCCCCQTRFIATCTPTIYDLSSSCRHRYPDVNFFAAQRWPTELHNKCTQSLTPWSATYFITHYCHLLFRVILTAATTEETFNFYFFNCPSFPQLLLFHLRMGQKVMPYCFAEETTSQLSFMGVHEVIHSQQFHSIATLSTGLIFDATTTTTSSHLFERRASSRLKTLTRP